MSWFRKRLGETSTWAGLAAVLAGVGIHLDPSLVAALAQWGAMLGGALLIVHKEK